MKPGDAPTVAVSYPRGRPARQRPVVATRDDYVTAARRVAIRKDRLAIGRRSFQPDGTGGVIELSDLVAGGREHDRVEPALGIGMPGCDQGRGCGVGIDDVDPVVVEVEAEGTDVTGP